MKTPTVVDYTGLVGKTHQRLTITGYLGKLDKYHWYSYRCHCGKEGKFRRHAFGSQESCGCRKIEILLANPNKKTHGKSDSSIYKRWRSMLARCYSVTNSRYECYGGRGIKVCASWHKFGNFYKDMGDPPFQGASIDRVDTNGDYTKSNCRWVDQKTQQNNRRNNRRLVYNGVTKTLAEWADEMGISPLILRQRLERDQWSLERALTTPHRGDRSCFVCVARN